MLIKLGEGQYRIEYDFNAMCLIEDHLDMTITEIMYNESKIGFSAIRAFLAAGLNKHHPEIDINHTGSLMQGYIKKGGNLKSLLQRMFEQMKADGLASQGENNPQKREKKTYHGDRKS